MRLALSSVCSYLCAFLWNLIKWKWKNKVFARLWKVSYSNKGRERLRLLRLQFHSLRLHQDDKNHCAHVYDSMLLSKAAKINTKIFALVVLSLHQHKHLPVLTCHFGQTTLNMTNLFSPGGTSRFVPENSPALSWCDHHQCLSNSQGPATVRNDKQSCEFHRQHLHRQMKITFWDCLLSITEGGLVRGVWLCYDKIYLILP